MVHCVFDSFDVIAKWLVRHRVLRVKFHLGYLFHQLSGRAVVRSLVRLGIALLVALLTVCSLDRWIDQLVDGSFGLVLCMLMDTLVGCWLMLMDVGFCVLSLVCMSQTPRMLDNQGNAHLRSPPPPDWDGVERLTAKTFVVPQEDFETEQLDPDTLSVLEDIATL